jgi:hypothetical protein
MVKIFDKDYSKSGECDFALVEGKWLPIESKEVKYAKLNPPVKMNFRPRPEDSLFPNHNKEFTLTVTHDGKPIGEPIESSICILGPNADYIDAVKKALDIGKKYESEFIEKTNSSQSKGF